VPRRHAGARLMIKRGRVLRLATLTTPRCACGCLPPLSRGETLSFGTIRTTWNPLDGLGYASGARANLLLACAQACVPLDEFNDVAQAVPYGAPDLDVAAPGTTGALALDRPRRAAAHPRVLSLYKQVIGIVVHAVTVISGRPVARSDGTLQKVAR
jgi:hypothetical protein